MTGATQESGRDVLAAAMREGKWVLVAPDGRLWAANEVSRLSTVILMHSDVLQPVLTVGLDEAGGDDGKA